VPAVTIAKLHGPTIWLCDLDHWALSLKMNFGSESCSFKSCHSSLFHVGQKREALPP
jgi:hypothetical protein